MVNGAKVSRELFIFNILGVYVSLVCSYFNVEEIYGVKYGFEISSEPVLLKENSDLGNTLLLSSKHGQQYQCVLPQLESSDKKNEEAQHITKDEIPLLLEPMKKKCLYNNKGWWTYEVCFGQGIYQYHKEANDIVGDKISLGVFSNETDWSQEKIDLKEKPKPGKSSVVKRYHSQYYVNGSDCDLTGKAREAQIKIYCDEGISDVILRVDEPSSCSYVITVHTSKLCQHNLFKPSPTQKPQAITCSPALSEERYKIYVEKIELKKKAKEQAEAAKIKAQKERAAKKSKSEYGFEYDEEAERKRRSRRSPVWPWESPGVEYEDEMFIDGKIEEDKIDVHRLDITKGRKKTAEGYHEEEGITVMSQKMHRNREPEDKRQKGENDETAKEISEKQDASKETGEIEKSEVDGDKNKDATEQTDKQGGKIKEGTSEDSVEEKDIESSETENDGSRKKKEKEASEADKELDDEWKKKMDEAILKLRSSLKEKLVKLGIKPEVLDQKFGEKLGSVGGEKDESPAGKDERPAGKGQSPAIKDETSAGKDESLAGKDESPASKDESPAAKDESPAEKDESLAGTDEVKAGKLKEETAEGQGVEKPEKTSQKDEFARTVDEIRKILKGDIMKEIMEAASATQAEMERQFDEERAKMKSDVELIKNKIKQMEETEEENEQLGETMNRVKESIERFEKTNMELDEDMQVLKELNDELLRIMEDKDNTETRGDLLQLSADSNKVLKKILLRRFQLEQDLRYIKRTGSKLSGSEEHGENTENVELGSTTKGGIDQVINKLKNMIQDLDNPEAGMGTGAGSDDTPGVKPGSSGTTAGVENGELASESDGLDEGDLGSGVRVKVHKIKKINIPEDEEAELEETELDEEEMEELNIDKRIRKATKKMEEMVKQQLRDSGVLPAGRIRVKIVTSKDALESLDEKSEGKLLSEKEETQFKDMILSLLGGSPEAGKERRRQEDLQNNYNLVWDDDDLQTVPREDDEADGEVEVVSY